MKALAASLLCALLLANPEAAAQTPPCGTVVHSSITLNQDLTCPAGMHAIVIGADHVRIELNGFSIVGPYSTRRPTGPGASAILSYRFEGVEIVGPGHIKGFMDPIWLHGGNGHLIQDVQIEEGFEVVLRNTSGSRVEGNRMGWLRLFSDPGESSMENSIVGNEVTRPIGNGGIALHGCGTAHNFVAHNEIHANTANAITIYEGANRNKVIGNKALLGPIVMTNSHGNYVSGNYVEIDPRSGGAGIVLQAFAPALACASGALVHTNGNTIVDNHVESSQMGVSFEGSPYFGGMVHDNRVTGNVISGQRTAHLYFTPDADFNDAGGNHYPTGLNVIDQGRGNLWP